MPFLKNLLGQSDPQSSKSSSAILAQQFDKDWFNAVKRFGIVAGFGAFRFDVRDPNTREIINPHEGLAGTFDDWQQIKSPWDRQLHLFELLLDTMNKSMKLWQIANVLTAIRLPNRAVALLQENALPTPDSDDYTQVCSAFSKGFIGLQDGENALIWAQKAAEAKPDNAHLQVVLADA